MVMHSLGLKSIPVILNVELQPFRFSRFGVMMGAIIGWLLNFVVTSLTERVVEDIGWMGAFLLSATISTVFLILLSLVLSETHGVDLEESEKLHLF